MDVTKINGSSLEVFLHNDTLEFLEMEDPVEYMNVSGPSDAVFTMMEVSKTFHYIASIFGLIGNLLVIGIYLKYSKMKTITNAYIVNLAIVDFIYVVTVPVFLLSMWHNSWPFGEFICKLLLSKGAIHRFASSLFLAVICADRYLAVCKPTISHLCYKNKNNVKLICASTWIICSLAVAPVFYHSGTFTIPGSEITNCELLWTGPTRESYIWFTIILAFLLPTIAKVFFAIPILYALASNESTDGQYQVFTNRNKRLTYFVLVITLIHFILWLPLWISLISINLMPSNIHPDNATILLHLLSGCIGMANTVINPILYFRLSPDFKDGLNKFIKCIPNGGSSNGDITAQDQISEAMDERNSRSRRDKFDNPISNGN